MQGAKEVFVILILRAWKKLFFGVDGEFNLHVVLYAIGFCDVFIADAEVAAFDGCCANGGGGAVGC